MYVCLCKAVTDRQIKEFVNGGAGSFEEVCKQLGVATQCGKCSQLAQNIVEATVKKNVRRSLQLVSPSPLTPQNKYKYEQYAFVFIVLCRKIRHLSPAQSGQSAVSGHNSPCLNPENPDLNYGNPMKGDSKVIEHLNKVLGNELIAINQYFLHAKMFEDWGLQELAEYTRHESIDEMKHADEIIDRILFLEGFPNLQDLGSCTSARTPRKCCAATLDLEMRAIPDLREAVAYCESVEGLSSRDLFQGILNDEENHVDWLETQLGLIEKMGIQNYLAEKMDEGGN